jgi:hypothetical protein
MGLYGRQREQTGTDRDNLLRSIQIGAFCFIVD